MHIRNKLNVKQLAGITKPGIYSDGGGLYLRVRKTGTRSWLYVCMIRGRRRELGLGSVLDVSLAKAREKASEVRAIFLDGRDPVLERNKAKVAIMPKMTFGEVANSLIDDLEKGFRNEKHKKQWRSSIQNYAAPIMNTPVDQVETDDVVKILRPIWQEKRETAARVRGRIERILDAAKARNLRSGENPARWRGHLDSLLPRQSKKTVKHHAAIDFADLPPFMAKLRKRKAVAAQALEFTILTAARTGETVGMTWSEIDIDNKIWTIPADRMKAGHQHQVPLSEATVILLHKIMPKRKESGALVFCGNSNGTLSNMAMSMLLRRMGRNDITVHGFRSTFRDWAGEKTSHAREDIEMALAHTIQSATERAYRRGRALEKRRLLMEEWAEFCD